MVRGIQSSSNWRFLLIVLIVLLFVYYSRPQAKQADTSWWQIQSVDTMKYSRDVARQKLNDPSFDLIIEDQVAKIAEVGATHVAVGTPYDEEFLPVLRRWVAAARRHNLNVWFRGNFSGWERWFGYPPISRKEHIRKTKDFIGKNQDLFADGDLFTPCTECENGGPGDPRRTGDVAGHRQFLKDLYQVSTDAFRSKGKQVQTGLFSMNGDVARLIMDRETTEALGGIVVIDHYVASPNNFAKDVVEIAKRSGGQVVIGEFGAPIPDIHGKMSDREQGEWLRQSLTKLADIREVTGINYWVGVGGSTQLWDKDGKAKPAVEILKGFYAPKVASGVVKNEIGKPIADAIVRIGKRETVSDKRGKFQLAFVDGEVTARVTAPGYLEAEVRIAQESEQLAIMLTKTQDSFLFRLAKFFYRLRSFR